MATKSCCRSAARTANPRDFCGSLSMSTPVLLVAAGNGVAVMVLTPGGQRMALDTAIAQFQCADGTSGLRLARIVLQGVRSLHKVAVESKLDRQMPLLTLRDLLKQNVPICTACRGTGCATCSQTGFP